VFELEKTGRETVLYGFTGGTDGAFPSADLVRDAAGNLCGTTYIGGEATGCSGGCGVVFKLDTTGVETVLHSFTGGADGANPATPYAFGFVRHSLRHGPSRRNRLRRRVQNRSMIRASSTTAELH